MNITYKDKVTDPMYPIMAGDSPLAKEFNAREKQLWLDGKLGIDDSSPDPVKVRREIYDQVNMVLMEILTDDYNKRNARIKKAK